MLLAGVVALPTPALTNPATTSIDLYQPAVTASHQSALLKKVAVISSPGLPKDEFLEHKRKMKWMPKIIVYSYIHGRYASLGFGSVTIFLRIVLGIGSTSKKQANKSSPSVTENEAAHNHHSGTMGSELVGKKELKPPKKNGKNKQWYERDATMRDSFGERQPDDVDGHSGKPSCQIYNMMFG